MRFYVSSQSQILVAAAVAVAAMMALAGLAIFAWRVLSESMQRTTLDDAELVCRYCKAKAVHPSFPTGILDRLLGFFAWVPYRCYVCSWRFYLHRPHSAGRAASQVH